jgi:hypothetical protein
MAGLWLGRLIAGGSPLIPGVDPGLAHICSVDNKLALILTFPRVFNSLFPFQYHSTNAAPILIHNGLMSYNIIADPGGRTV